MLFLKMTKGKVLFVIFGIFSIFAGEVEVLYERRADFG